MIIRSNKFLILLILGFVMGSSAAKAGKPMTVNCGKRVIDGEVHVFDNIPAVRNAKGFKVLSFKATKPNGEWNDGICVVQFR